MVVSNRGRIPRTCSGDPPNCLKGQGMNMKTNHALRISVALGSLAALALLLPVLGFVLLGLLTLVLPMLLVLSPVLVVLSLVFVANRFRGTPEPTAATGTEPASIGAPALHAPAPLSELGARGGWETQSRAPAVEAIAPATVEHHGQALVASTRGRRADHGRAASN